MISNNQPVQRTYQLHGLPRTGNHLLPLRKSVRRVRSQGITHQSRVPRIGSVQMRFAPEDPIGQLLPYEWRIMLTLGRHVVWINGEVCPRGL